MPVKVKQSRENQSKSVTKPAKFEFIDPSGKKRKPTLNIFEAESEICKQETSSDTIKSGRIVSIDEQDLLKNLTPAGEVGKAQKASTQFEERAHDLSLAAKLKAEYFDKLPDRLDLQKQTADMLGKAGLRGDKLDVAASVAVEGHFGTLLDEAWSKIPSYKDEKEARKSRAEKWDVYSHYDEYWKMWSDAGFLFRDQMSKYDDHLVGLLQTYCGRDGLSKDRWLPPVKSVRIDQEIENLELMTGKDAQRVTSIASIRKSREQTAPS